MYSVVLLVAMSTGGQSADFHHGCHGCCGYSSCCGYSYGCHGCCGYSYGCCGYSSCCGYSYGCCGYSSCCGYSYGCCGWTYPAGGYWSCHGCCGYIAAYPSCCGTISYPSCCGTISYPGCGCTGVIYGTGVIHGCGVSQAPATPVVSATAVASAAEAKPATLIVNLPAEAKLTVGGMLTKATSERRVFVSPELAPGKTYQYTLKAELVRNGKSVSWEKTVSVEAGKEVSISLTPPATAVAARYLPLVDFRKHRRGRPSWDAPLSF
jgi:uncharacterized protein (TIGR03000 family)